MDYEIGHINLSTLTEAKAKNQLEANQSSNSNTVNGHLQSSLEEDDKPIVGWHTDSYPFVCVLMMSDCIGMIGGETALKKADGSILKVRGPTEVCIPWSPNEFFGDVTQCIGVRNDATRKIHLSQSHARAWDSRAYHLRHQLSAEIGLGKGRQRVANSSADF